MQGTFLKLFFLLESGPRRERQKGGLVRLITSYRCLLPVVSAINKFRISLMYYAGGAHPELAGRDITLFFATENDAAAFCSIMTIRILWWTPEISHECTNYIHSCIRG